jgi:hypothetical protein
MRYLLISFVLLFGMLPVVEAQQTIRVHGFITDEQAESVAFVNVSMLNFNGGTASDINGKYELKVPL